MFDKRLDAQAGVSIAESVQLDQPRGSQKEAARVKKETVDLEGIDRRISGRFALRSVRRNSEIVFEVFRRFDGRI